MENIKIFVELLQINMQNYIQMISPVICHCRPQSIHANYAAQSHNVIVILIIM